MPTDAAAIPRATYESFGERLGVGVEVVVAGAGWSTVKPPSEGVSVESRRHLTRSVGVPASIPRRLENRGAAPEGTPAGRSLRDRD